MLGDKDKGLPQYYTQKNVMRIFYDTSYQMLTNDTSYQMLQKHSSIFSQKN